MTNRQTEKKVRDKLQETKDLGVDAQVDAVMAAIDSPSPVATDELWKILIKGLLLLLIISLISLVVLIIVDEKTSAIATAFTALLTGLLGLFATSSKKGGNE